MQFTLLANIYKKTKLNYTLHAFNLYLQQYPLKEYFRHNENIVVAKQCMLYISRTIKTV